MKASSLTLVLAIACYSSQPVSAQETLYGFGFSKSRGVELLKDIVAVCYTVKVKVKTVDADGSAVLNEFESNKVEQSLESSIEPVLQRYGVPVSKCTKDDYRSKSMTVFSLGASVSPNNADRTLLEVRVNSDLAEVVRSSRVERLGRVNILMANNVKMTRNKDLLLLSITGLSVRQANWTADVVTEQKLK
jgi:hypothetical protein